MKTNRTWRFYKILILLLTCLSPQSFAQAPPRDDTNWQPYSIGPDAEVYTIHTNPTSFPLHMYVGGAFTNFEGRPANHIAHFNSEFWESLGGGYGGTTQLFAGGNFTRAHNGPALNHIGKFDLYTNTWEPLGDGVASASTPIVRSIVVAPIPSVGNYVQINMSLVYVGGRFTEATNPDGSKTFCRNPIWFEWRRNHDCAFI